MSIRPAAYEAVIHLADIEPPVWRRLILSSTMTLHELHRAIQILFSWYDSHLYEFEFKGRRFAPPNPDEEVEDSTQVRLVDLKLRVGAQLHYTYDFGDEWLHVIEFERMRVRTNGVTLPWLWEGERRGPPEDSGGPLGYMQLLESLDAPLEDLPDEAREKAVWAGLDFDPEHFDVAETRRMLLLLSCWTTEQDS